MQSLPYGVVDFPAEEAVEMTLSYNACNKDPWQHALNLKMPGKVLQCPDIMLISRLECLPNPPKT